MTKPTVHQPELGATLERLEATIARRLYANPESSYIAKLFAGGVGKIAQKVGEEAVETVIAALGANREALVSEATDLIFHLAVLLKAKGISLEAVMAELERRDGISGLAEKASRHM